MDQETINKIIEKIEARRKHYEHIIKAYDGKSGEWEERWRAIGRVAIDECNDIIEIIKSIK